MGERNKAESNSRRLYDLTNEVSNLKSQLVEAQSNENYYYQQVQNLKKLNSELAQNRVEWDATQQNKMIVKCKGFTGTVKVTLDPVAHRLDLFID